MQLAGLPGQQMDHALGARDVLGHDDAVALPQLRANAGREPLDRDHRVRMQLPRRPGVADHVGAFPEKADAPPPHVQARAQAITGFR